jgi:uncharacterized membrane protein YqjE
MTDSDPQPPSAFSLARKLARTAIASLHNRAELFLVELEEEKIKFVELFLWTILAGFLGMMFLVVLTATIIFLFPESQRIYAAAGFCVLYLTGSVLALLNLRALWKSAPAAFSGSTAEAGKDSEWLESLE